MARGWQGASRTTDNFPAKLLQRNSVMLKITGTRFTLREKNSPVLNELVVQHFSTEISMKVSFLPSAPLTQRFLNHQHV